jgi:hypothetical protein
VSTKLNWIYSVTDPTGDFDGNGVKNLLQYARDLNSAPPTGVGVPAVTQSAGSASVTYLKITDAPALTYQVEQSTDQVSWTTASTSDAVVSTNDNIATIRATVSNSSSAPLYLRLVITMQ